HRRDPGPQSAAPRDRRGGGDDAARLGDRGPRGRERRQLRAHACRRDRGAQRHHRPRTARPRGDAAGAREPDVLAQRVRAARAPGARRQAERGLERRDHARELPHVRRPRRERADTRGEDCMNGALMAEIWVFALAVFVGFEVISKVPVVLHTPLMSGTNAIHGIVMLGGVLVLASAHGPALTILGFLAVMLGAMNLFGGVAVTRRMLERVNATKDTPSAPGANP